MRRSALATRVIVAISLLVLTSAIAGMVFAAKARGDPIQPLTGTSFGGILESAGLLFFAFAGYARIATLGEEVRDPVRTIPLAIPLALGITLVVYSALAVILLLRLGPTALSAAVDPVARAVATTSWEWLIPVVRVGATLAALGSLLTLVLGVSRTTFAMARNTHLPAFLAAVHPRYGVPHHAELATGVAVAAVVSLVDLRGALGFSSFAVLSYYAVTNAGAFTLRAVENRAPRIMAVAGLAGCVMLAFSLPVRSVIGGSIALAVGAVFWVLPRTRH